MVDCRGTLLVTSVGCHDTYVVYFHELHGAQLGLEFAKLHEVPEFYVETCIGGCVLSWKWVPPRPSASQHLAERVVMDQ